MPRAKKFNPSSSNQSRVSPYKFKNKKLESCDDQKFQLEETRCSICKEHPDNLVLLICSSHEQGCRPYMCNASYPYSNCFDQVCKLYGLTPSKSTSDQPNGFAGRSKSQLVCPLCWGNVSGWVVEEAATRFLNSRVQNCAIGSCDFSGNFGELRRHALLEHHSTRTIF